MELICEDISDTGPAATMERGHDIMMGRDTGGD